MTQFELQPATLDEMPVVANLVRYYIYDMSEYMGWPVSASGLFGGVDDLSRYWSDARCHPFLMKLNNEIVGFGLVDGAPEREDTDWRMGEFFVLRKFRKRGIGSAAAYRLFDQFPGRWQVDQLAGNSPAVEFWRHVVDKYTDGHFVETTAISPWGPENVLLFDSKEAPKTE